MSAVAERDINLSGTCPPAIYFKYDWRADLGNLGPPNGAVFKGRGFIQLTGRRNYQYFGNLLATGEMASTRLAIAGDQSGAFYNRSPGPSGWRFPQILRPSNGLSP